MNLQWNISCYHLLFHRIDVKIFLATLSDLDVGNQSSKPVQFRQQCTRISTLNPVASANPCTFSCH